MISGWRLAKLRDLTTKIGSGATPRGGQESYQSEGISLIRSLNVHDCTFKYKDLARIDDDQATKLDNVIVKGGDVLLNITGASIARCCVVPDDCLPARVNQHVSILRPKPEILDSRFLSYLLVSKKYKDDLLHSGEKAGSTRQALTKGQLQDFEIAYPPLKIQKRIVVILDDAFERINTAIANTEKNLANARELFESYLDNTFAKRGGDWRTYPLASLCEKKRGISYGVIKLGVEVPDGVPCLRTSNVRWLMIETDNVKRIDKKLSLEYNRTILQGGEVLVNIRGTLGGVAVAPIEMKSWNVSREVAVVPVDNAMVNSEFLAFYIGSKGSQAWLANVHKGVAYTGINLSDLRSLPVALPDVKIQQNVVEEIKQAMSHSTGLQDVQKKRLHSLSELKQSLLQRAFAGELTTDFNPDSLVN